MELSTDVKVSLEEETQRHHRLAERWDTLVKEIRSLPGFEAFLLPKPVSVLKKAAELGPVVVINVHGRCDALILQKDRDNVHHIPLDKLRDQDVEKMQKLLREALVNLHLLSRGEYRGDATAAGLSRELEVVLSRLWSNLVEPILKGLDLKAEKSNPLDVPPRIWWCPTGPLTFLPLHAAGQKVKGRRHETSNYVVSSYTPTVNALIEARAVERRPFSQLVGIAMGQTPGNWGPLPNASEELNRIERLFPARSNWRIQTLRNEEATGERVLAAIKMSNWTHLACHAVQDVGEPTQSGIHLQDGRLKITDIVSKPVAHADLAFLSACQTATGDEKTSDEAVHITGAMLGAGYRSVIGTMWSIPDAAAPIIAENVYKKLFSGPGEPNSDEAARALHEGVKELRKTEPSFYGWAPFVHYGV